MRKDDRFPNLFILGMTQAGNLISNITSNLAEAGMSVGAVVAHTLRVGAEQVEVSAAAEQASRALAIPVTGLDLLVPAVEGPDYVIIEANERPGLANHEPQPTAQRFIDLLFPSTRIQGET